MCVATGGDPNHMTDDLISHLLVDHHGGHKPDANISFQSLFLGVVNTRIGLCSWDHLSDRGII